MRQIVAAVIGIAITVAVVWIFFSTTKANRVTAEAKIGKVRTLDPDPSGSFAVIDFSVTNVSDHPVVILGIASAAVELADGSTHQGRAVAGSTLKNVFTNYPVVGPQYDDALQAKDVIPPHKSIDRMAGITFDVPAEAMSKRKAIVLKLQDIAGPVLEMRSK